jgi:hypothetical protein
MKICDEANGFNLKVLKNPCNESMVQINDTRNDDRILIVMSDEWEQLKNKIDKMFIALGKMDGL